MVSIVQIFDGNQGMKKLVHILATLTYMLVLWLCLFKISSIPVSSSNPKDTVFHGSHSSIICLFVMLSTTPDAYMHIVAIYITLLGECIALWGKPNEPSIQHYVYIFMQCVDIASC